MLFVLGLSIVLLLGLVVLYLGVLWLVVLCLVLWSLAGPIVVTCFAAIRVDCLGG